MGHGARIIADSISPDGVRLTSFEVTIPRIILAEFNTHRMLSRNSASSRAVPVKKMIQRVLEDPYVPTSWGKNQKGMQAGEEVSEERDFSVVACSRHLAGGNFTRMRCEDCVYIMKHGWPSAQERAVSHWLKARDEAVRYANALLNLGIHKQITNRLLEPFMWHTVLVTATEWDNFFHLRNNPDAHPDFQVVAEMMQELYEAYDPEPLDYGEWHTPLWPMRSDLIDPATGEDLPAPSLHAIRMISVGRCARVSYLTHDGVRAPLEDVKLHDRLLKSGHMSPFEHVAQPAKAHDWNAWFGNFRGWVQYRKLIPYEHDILGPREETTT